MGCLYVAFDVETPNHMNNRISSIGVTIIDEEGKLDTKEYLVNPECDFDDFNISLTGITPAMVKDAPIFPAVWEELEPFFTNHVLIAHNARFDLSVFTKNTNCLWTVIAGSSLYLYVEMRNLLQKND